MLDTVVWKGAAERREYCKGCRGLAAEARARFARNLRDGTESFCVFSSRKDTPFRGLRRVACENSRWMRKVPQGQARFIISLVRRGARLSLSGPVSWSLGIDWGCSEDLCGDSESLSFGFHVSVAL